MASKTKSCQEGGIVFGDWKLFELDDRNWELCHRHETADTKTARVAGSVGKTQWHRLGRYYQHDTFGNALLYAADVELKAKCRDVAMQLTDAMREHERIVGELVGAFQDSVGGDA